MRDAGDHYEYIAKYIDDLLIVSSNPMKIIEQVQRPAGPYDLKGTGVPEYYLGGDVHCTYSGDRITELWTSAKTYIKRITEKVERLMEWRLRHLVNPMNPDYHPEVDESEFLVGDDVSKYRMMVGSLNWLVTLGRYDIQYTAASLARHMMAPRQGHMDAMRRIFGYLKFNSKIKIVYDTSEPDFSCHKIETFDWFALYGQVKEEMPYGMPVPKGNPVIISGFFDSSHSSCLVTRRSTTGILMFLNKTPIKWYSKRQATVETSTYGSEMVAGRIAVEQSIDLRYTLRMLGVEVKGPTILFGDNKSMITNTSLPHSTLKKRSNANAYHRCREAVAAGFIRMVHCGTKFNLADMGTKALNGPGHQFLLQNQNFPPVSTAGECQTASSDTIEVSQNPDRTSAKLTIVQSSGLEEELFGALQSKSFLSFLRTTFDG